MYITNIMAQVPLGTHHTVLSIMPGTNGEQDCTVGTLGMVLLYASGVGTSPLDFPQGIGIKVAAGTHIHLNLHLYNASDQSGTVTARMTRCATAGSIGIRPRTPVCSRARHFESDESGSDRFAHAVHSQMISELMHPSRV